MTIKLGVVMDPINSINYKKDTTLAMLLAAQKRGWEIFYMEQQDLYLEDGEAYANMRPLRVYSNPDGWYDLGESEDSLLANLNVILMRKDPPVDQEFIVATHLLEYAQQAGSLVMNPPRGLRNYNEKLFATQFPQCCPPLLVSADMAKLKAFHAFHQDAIFKPLNGMGGMSVFRVKPGDPNVGVILETLTNHGKQSIMAQQFLPQIADGDKRILMIDGEPIPYALARVPLAGENRGNLAAGGTGIGVELSDRDRWICEQVGPKLKAEGLMFVGLDVIGDYLTEINVTSPTCVRELDTIYGLDICGQLMDKIETKLNRQN